MTTHRNLDTLPGFHFIYILDMNLVITMLADDLSCACDRPTSGRILTEKFDMFPSMYPWFELFLFIFMNLVMSFKMALRLTITRGGFLGRSTRFYFISACWSYFIFSTQPIVIDIVVVWNQCIDWNVTQPTLVGLTSEGIECRYLIDVLLGCFCPWILLFE